jgi:hypothetical protein
VTLTQFLFIFAFLVVGPLYGFFALRLSSCARPSRWKKPAKYCDIYDVYIVLAVAFAILSAYVGWLLTGLQAMETYPQYPHEGPGEVIAVLYTIPGFITGLLAVGLTFIIGKRFNVVVLVLLFITVMILLLAVGFFGFFGLLFPGQD